MWKGGGWALGSPIRLNPKPVGGGRAVSSDPLFCRHRSEEHRGRLEPAVRSGTSRRRSAGNCPAISAKLCTYYRKTSTQTGWKRHRFIRHTPPKRRSLVAWNYDPLEKGRDPEKLLSEALRQLQKREAPESASLPSPPWVQVGRLGQESLCAPGREAGERKQRQCPQGPWQQLCDNGVTPTLRRTATGGLSGCTPKRPTPGQGRTAGTQGRGAVLPRGIPGCSSTRLAPQRCSRGQGCSQVPAGAPRCCL